MLVADALDVVLAETVIEQRRAFDRFHRDDAGAELLLEVVAGGKRAARSRGGHESGELGAGAALRQRGEQLFHRRAGAHPVNQIIAELAELIEDDIGRIAVERGAGVVDFLDVAFRSRRADDVARIADPAVEPVEALLAHVLRQHGHAAAAENARNGDAAAAVVAGRRPHRAVARRVELAGHQARHQAAIGGQNFVRADHRKAVAQRQHDARLHAGQFGRQFHVIGHVATRLLRSAPLNQCTRKRLSGVGGVGVDAGEAGADARRNGRGILQLRDRGQHHAGLAQARSRAFEHRRVDDRAFKSETRHCRSFRVSCYRRHAAPQTGRALLRVRPRSHPCRRRSGGRFRPRRGPRQ